MQNPMCYGHILDLYIRYICFSFYFWYISGDQSMVKTTSLHCIKIISWSEIMYYWAYSNIFILFSTHTMSECHFENMFFLELPFWVWHIPFWGVGGVPSKCLKKFTDPMSFLRSLGPLGPISSTMSHITLAKEMVDLVQYLSHRDPSPTTWWIVSSLVGLCLPQNILV